MNPPVTDAPLSKSHRLVHDIVQEQGIGRHLAMADLFALAQARQPRIGFTTVYRAVTRLRDLGMISEITPHGAERAYYEPAGPQHAHFRCDRCGDVQDIVFAIPPAVTAALASQVGGEIASSTVHFRGRCAACSHLS